jgi:hypothetical protein
MATELAEVEHPADWDGKHRHLDLGRHLFYYYLPACSCGWRGLAADSPQAALRATLAQHLDFINMNERG